MADERWKYVVFNKSITEEESLDFYTTWAKDVSNNVSLVVEFQRWWVLKSKLFAQESTSTDIMLHPA